MSKIKILATNAKNNCAYWSENVTIYSEYLDELSAIWRTNKAESIVFNLKWAFRFFVKSRDYDAIATNADKASLIFAIMQLLFRRERKPHILLFVLWNLPENMLKRRIKLLLYKIILKSVSRVIVFSKKQQTLHSDAFGEPAKKFPVIPYHTTMRDVDIEIGEGDYLFAGGDTGRDYRTLIEAMRGLPYKLIIAALYRDHFDGINIPENVSIMTLNPDEFLQYIAKCRAMILPLYAGKLQAGGHQTFLNAMFMGKTVIVGDDNGAEEYISDGIDGFIVQPQNETDLRSAMVMVMENIELCRRIGINAKQKAQLFSKENFSSELLKIINNDVRLSSKALCQDSND